jgi:hypothetical protein
MYAIYAIVASTGVTVGTVARQIRIHVRDRDDRRFARHVFDHTRSTAELGGFANLVERRRPPGLLERPTKKDAGLDSG